MRPGEVKRPTSLSGDLIFRRTDEFAPEEPAVESRAVVPAAMPVTPYEPPLNYRHAPFLAHLIATRQQVPQTRERRRAEPAEAIAAYRLVAKLS